MKIDPMMLALLSKLFDSSLSTQEEALLHAWSLESQANRKLYERIKNRDLVLEDLNNWNKLLFDDRDNIWTEELSQKVYSKLRSQEVKSKKISVLNSIKIAAAIFIASFFVGYILYKNVMNTPVIEDIADVQPSGRQAYIKLPDGNVIPLDAKEKEVINQDILRYKDGKVLHEFDTDIVSKVELNTPKGSNYNIILPDGTKVWLNTESKLIYPTRFEGPNRAVELVGEAYFEVKSLAIKGKKIPFLVRTNSQMIEVLGTKFNISAYHDNAIKTTLVEGSVRIHKADKEILLVPGEQSFMDGNVLTKRSVDVELAKAWVENLFYFFETPLIDALTMLAQWYDIEIVHEENIPNTHLYGKISRDNGIKEVMKIMENSGLKFSLQRIDGHNKLVVNK